MIWVGLRSEVTAEPAREEGGSIEPSAELQNARTKQLEDEVPR
jgi:hypothetical protein